MSQIPVAILTEIPEPLHESMLGFLENRPDWDQDKVVTAALSLFLLQNRASKNGVDSCQNRVAARTYLDTYFKKSVSP